MSLYSLKILGINISLFCQVLFKTKFTDKIFVVKLPRVQLDITYFLSESSDSSVGGVGGTLELPCIKAKF